MNSYCADIDYVEWYFGWFQRRQAMHASQSYWYWDCFFLLNFAAYYSRRREQEKWWSRYLESMPILETYVIVMLTLRKFDASIYSFEKVEEDFQEKLLQMESVVRNGIYLYRKLSAMRAICRNFFIPISYHNGETFDSSGSRNFNKKKVAFWRLSMMFSIIITSGFCFIK